ncbi:MAG: PqqD family protein [Deltaproteobacteria bacterium]
MGKKLLSHLALSDDGFLFDSSTGSTFTLNATGTFILKKLIGGIGREGIAADIVASYDTSAEMVLRDLVQFFQFLTELGIIDTVPEET